MQTLLEPKLVPVDFYIGETSPANQDSLKFGYAPNHFETVPASTHFQISIHAPSSSFKRELQYIFTETSTANLLVLPTFQKSHYDLVSVTPQTNWERNVLLDHFMAFGRRFVHSLAKLNHWADLCDPASGYPVYSNRGTSLYPDVEGTTRFLKYPTHQAGCCKVLSHPSWGTNMYPGTLFTTAPLDVVVQVLDSICQMGPSFASLQSNRPLPKPVYSLTSS